MTTEWPQSPCCGVRVMPKARFCTKCGSALSAELRAQVAALEMPETPGYAPIVCMGCGLTLSLKEALEPVYHFMSGEQDERDTHAPATAAREGMVLSYTGALDDYAGQRGLSPPERATLLRDSVVAAYERVGRIREAAMPPRPGYTAGKCFVRDCGRCGSSDPAMLERDALAGLEAIKRLPR